MSLSAPDPGGGNLGAMLGLLADPAALKAQYDEFEKRQAAAQAVIDLVGPASEIATLNAKAKADAQAASDALAEAKATAAKIVADAQDTAAGTQKQAEAAAQAVMDHAAEVKADAEAAAADAASKLAALASAQADLASRERTLAEGSASMSAYATQLRQKEDELMKGADLLAEVRAALSAAFKEQLGKLGA